MIKDLEPYLVKFEENGLMKTKTYLDNYAIGNNIYWLVIVITYDKYIFFANNRI